MSFPDRKGKMTWLFALQSQFSCVSDLALDAFIIDGYGDIRKAS